MRRRHWIIITGFGLTAMFGYWLAGTATPDPPTKSPPKVAKVQARRSAGADDPAPKFRTGDRVPGFQRDEDAMANGALPGQRILTFTDQASLEAFLQRAGDRISVLGRLDALNALRIGFSDFLDLASLLDGTEEESLIFPVDIPVPGNASAQAGAVPLGAGLLEWLGISMDNSAWGAGVRIAVLDTGVTSNRAFSSSISALNLVGLPADLADQNGHGTAVASMIIGQSSLTPGVAPGAEILSIRIANDLGQSNSFLLAQGIIAAVDGGAQLINISMGSLGDSGLVRSAIEYAHAAGAMIIAAAGNNGLDRVSYPAANHGVIAVGAVDALGNHLDFSNTGSEIAISAPGYGVNAAWTGNMAASVSGTSFSSPIIAGAIAALMSRPGEPQLTAQQASNLLFSYLNDGGAEGTDTAYGAGMPDIGRALNGTTSGIFDAAVASQRVIGPTTANPSGQLEVLVQNRGTETLVNTNVNVTTPSGVVNSNITSLRPGETRTVKVPIAYQPDSSVRFESSVSLSNGRQDIKPSNDRRSEIFAPTTK
jgi:hypothetical protein